MLTQSPTLTGFQFCSFFAFNISNFMSIYSNQQTLQLIQIMIPSPFSSFPYFHPHQSFNPFQHSQTAYFFPKEAYLIPHDALASYDIAQIKKNRNFQSLQFLTKQILDRGINQKWFQEESRESKTKIINFLQLLFCYNYFSKVYRAQVTQILEKQIKQRQEQYSKKKKQVKKAQEKRKQLQEQISIKKASLKQYRQYLQSLHKCIICHSYVKNIAKHMDRHQNQQKINYERKRESEFDQFLKTQHYEDRMMINTLMLQRTTLQNTILSTATFSLQKQEIMLEKNYEMKTNMLTTLFQKERQLMQLKIRHQNSQRLRNQQNQQMKKMGNKYSSLEAEIAKLKQDLAATRETRHYHRDFGTSTMMNELRSRSQSPLENPPRIHKTKSIILEGPSNNNSLNPQNPEEFEERPNRLLTQSSHIYKDNESTFSHSQTRFRNFESIKDQIFAGNTEFCTKYPYRKQ